MTYLFLSPPDVGSTEREMLLAAVTSGWVAPVGPDLDAFESELAACVGVSDAVALNSGTAALHLALIVAGVGPGDAVLVPSFTFAATANAVMYTGAQPVFIDAARSTWTLDPELVEAELRARARVGRLPKAVMAVDIYGQCADYAVLALLCEEFGIPLLEDAAEALGSTYGDRRAGSIGQASAVSFNGNKIITCGGGGALLTDDGAFAARVRHLATQAREPVAHYEHRFVGYNYRLSNLLAAVGRAQLTDLDRRVARRRQINSLYREALQDLPGLTFMPDAPYGRSNCWLTCVLIDRHEFGSSRDEVRGHLHASGIETRPLWKPMHLQPVYVGAQRRGGSVSAALFEQGLCLPSGTAMSDADVVRVAGELARVHQCGRFLDGVGTR